MNNQLVFTSIRELGELLKSRQVSAMQLSDIFLDRLEQRGPNYNALTTLTRELASEQAARAEREISAGDYKGPLHGIPWGAKDLLATAGGIPTSWGAAPFKDQTFDFDATVVRRLDEAGAVLAGKLAMIELAGGMGYRQPHATFTGPPRNPWNRETWTGGSSAGSGAAVAAGLVPFAIGSETWGSILSPANNCGLAGLRPTYGRVSRYGAMALCWTLDKLGPLCLTADDCGLVLEAIAGPDANDPTAANLTFTYDDSPSGDKRFKIGILKDVTVGAEEPVKANFEKAMAAMSEVADVEEVEFPDYPYVAAVRTILNVESAAAFEDFIEDGTAAQLTAPEDHYGPYARTSVLATDYVKALRLRGLMSKEVDDVMSKYDAIAAPTSPRVASPIDEEFRKASPSPGPGDLMGAIGNGCGLPSISVPSGFTETGLPTGIQFMGRPYRENTILAIARAYQDMTDWHTRHPEDALEG
jgi:aspartyl-tRNA(Asn)/glutamyl-tRNA(Gln) amidotransferase subunit A